MKLLRVIVAIESFNQGDLWHSLATDWFETFLLLTKVII